jgi:cell wall assembly regulator SMI1
MPSCVRNVVRPMIAASKKEHLGPHASRLALPSIHRKWEPLAAGASYTSDDVTLNHYVYDWHEEGEYEFDGRRFNVIRPQFLPVVDERTGNPLGFSLAPAPNYNSWQIRTLMTRICMRPEIGLPFERFLFELGIWKSRNVQALAQWASIDESFHRNGIALKLRHATTPKAKVIERVILTLQNLDEYAPGYIGRCEQRVKYERVEDFLEKLKRYGQPLKPGVNPADMLMSTDECATMLSEVMQRFAGEPQNGEMLDGISPAEGWRELSDGRVHDVLPESLRFILGTAESKQTVTSEGIVLRIGNRKHYYCGSAQLGALQGEKVCVRYNPELPEQVIVSHLATDPRGLHPFAVPLFHRVSAINATAEEFRNARDHQARFVSYGRALYRELPPKSNVTICHAKIGSPELRAVGEAISHLERECVALNNEREAERGEIKRLAARQNLNLDPSKVRRPSRVAKHLRSAEEWEAKILAREKTEASP